MTQWDYPWQLGTVSNGVLQYRIGSDTTWHDVTSATTVTTSVSSSEQIHIRLNATYPYVANSITYQYYRDGSLYRTSTYVKDQSYYGQDIWPTGLSDRYDTSDDNSWCSVTGTTVIDGDSFTISFQGHNSTWSGSAQGVWCSPGDMLYRDSNNVVRVERAYGVTVYQTLTPDTGYEVSSITYNGQEVTSAGVALITGVATIHGWAEPETVTVRVYRGNWPYVGTYNDHSSTSTYIDVSGSTGSTYDVCWSQWPGNDTKNICDSGSNTQYGGLDFDVITFGTTSSPVYAGKSYTPLTKTITASAGTGGTVTPSGATNVTYGSNQTFTAIPSSGYRFSHWLVDGNNGGSNLSYTFSNVTADHTIQAVFTNEVTFDVSGWSSGLQLGVTIGSGSEQTITSSAAFTALTATTGESVAIRLIQAPTGVQIDNVKYTFSDESETHYSQEVTSALPVSLTIPATVDGYATAIFSMAIVSSTITYTITASATTGGSIDPSGAVSVNHGGSQTFTATANTGYRFDHWVVDGEIEPDE